MEKADPSQEELLKLYRNAVSSGNRGVADVAAAALQARSRMTAAAGEARALAKLANEM